MYIYIYICMCVCLIYFHHMFSYVFICFHMFSYVFICFVLMCVVLFGSRKRTKKRRKQIVPRSGLHQVAAAVHQHHE